MKYSDCKWCKGKGCLYCNAEREKATENLDIQPIFSADLTNDKDVELLKSLFGKEALDRAFEEAQSSYDPKAEFSRLMNINGLTGRLVQLSRRKESDSE
jgi:hypothetical protein